MNPEAVATYRIQLRPGFGFREATALVPYLRALGISHLYCSPYLQAARGSNHGYDVTDPTRLNQELGTAEDHTALCRTLREAEMGQIVDVVPNHMAISGHENPWWWDVLENGPSSRYADYFDVDWEASEERWPNKVLLPVLGDHYGRVLEAGRLRITRESSAFYVRHHDNPFPVDPSTLGEILYPAAQNCGSARLAFLADSFTALPRPSLPDRKLVEQRHRNREVLLRILGELLMNSQIGNAVDLEIDNLNDDFDRLDGLLEKQNYRLAYWKTASRDLGYRRFFDIKDLIGLKVEENEVFTASHALLLSWVDEGLIQGLRIDHPDGLRDPAAYLFRLVECCPESWILAEKILAPDESLPPDWQIAGTTGYDFLNRAGQLLIDPAGEKTLTDFYSTFTGESRSFTEIVVESKRYVLEHLLGSEVNRLTSLFIDVCERHRRNRDYTDSELARALLETAVHFPVYRSYVCASRNTVTDFDEEVIERATSLASKEQPDLDPELFSFLKNILTLQLQGSLEGELAMRFQQLTGPAMAKGVEDTAFYRFNRLLCLNEVGGDPKRFGTGTEPFHQACLRAREKSPRSLLTTSTHDTKRGEDMRARLAVLSEIPEQWSEAVTDWSRHNERHRTGEVPDRNMEYFIYQTLTGAWPIGKERLLNYMEKAVREAKHHSSWTWPNAEYEESLKRFVTSILSDETFTSTLTAFVEKIVPAGRINSLSQTLLKLTAPGVPDIYQGSELWNFCLVDPDNRRAVDFHERKRLLKELPTLTPDRIMARMDEGLPKLWIIQRVLRHRRNHPEPFGPDGSYAPLTVQGTMARHALAFARGGRAITVIPRLCMNRQGNWEETSLSLPPGRWVNLLTAESHPGGPAFVKNLLKNFPVAFLVSEEN